MNINCTNSCVYQVEGKCDLEELPIFTSIAEAEVESDCPYYKNIKNSQ